MKINNRILLFYVLPTLSPLLLPPAILTQSILAVVFVAAIFLGAGFLLQRGKSLALTFLIFLLGLNFVVRLLLFFAHSVSPEGIVDWPFTITSILSLILSFYLVFRLDQVDIRAQLKS